MKQATILEGDALELFETWDQELDLIVTDPPYAFGGSGSEHALSATVAIVLRESATRLKRGSWMVVYCASSWRSTAYAIESVRGIVEPVRFATWVKPQSRTKVNVPGWAWASVNIVAFRKGPKNRPELEPHPNLDWIEASPVTNGRRAELPKEVARWSVQPFIIPGGVFLDPFAGPGAIVHAAAAEGMSAWGFEVHP